MRLSKRIENCTCPDKGRMDYLKFRSLGDDENQVLCKLCGSPIMNERDGQMRPNASYTEITVEFTDRSAHETAICKTCSKSLSMENVEFLYMADLKQWQREIDDDLEHFNKEIKSFRLGSRAI